MKPLFKLSRRVTQGLYLLGALGSLSGRADAQVGQLAAPVLSHPILAGAKPGPGGSVALPDGVNVQLNQRGGYLLSAVITVVHPQAVNLNVITHLTTAKATATVQEGAPQADQGTAGAIKLLGVLSGFGAGLTGPLTEFLARPDVVKRLPTGVHVQADPFVIGAQTQGRVLRLTLSPQQLPAQAFKPAAHVQAAKQPGAPGVALRVYSDFQCPYCEQFETGTFPALMKQLPADVSVEFHQFPLENIHPLARPAAEASECAAQQGKFWPFKEALFADRRWLKGNSNAGFTAVAQRLGLSPTSFKSCLAHRGGKAAVDAAVKEALELNVGGTPTVFVNGFQAADPYDAAALLKLIGFARVAAAAPAYQLHPPLLAVPASPLPSRAAPKQP